MEDPRDRYLSKAKGGGGKVTPGVEKHETSTDGGLGVPRFAQGPRRRVYKPWFRSRVHRSVGQIVLEPEHSGSEGHSVQDDAT